MIAKRIFDFIVSLIVLILFSPVMFVISIIIFMKMGFPILHKQVRPGLGGRPFLLYKFRSMLDLRDDSGILLADDHRLTRFGRFLRSTSLDELPELWNVLCGEMSLVGPRPLLLEYLDRYDSQQQKRQDVKPGITGWAQINGRNNLSWEERFQCDIWYINHWTFWLDLKILIKTIFMTLRREGINPEGRSTMPEFLGSGPERKQNRIKFH